MKTLAIRLEDELHAQFTVIAQLEQLTITDAIRQAIEQFVETKRTQPELTARAEEILADIDREAAQRREAISVLFGPDPASPAEEPPEATEEPTAGRPRRGRNTQMGFQGSRITG